MSAAKSIRYLTALLLPLLFAGQAHAAAQPSEAEIQAKIEAELAALKQAPKPPPPAPPPPAAPPAPTIPLPPVKVPHTVPVILATSLGEIVIAVEDERAPVTAANFLRYVDQKRLDGTVFYRAFTFDDFPDIGMVQGGTQNDPKRILKPVAHEPTSKTGLTHDDGAVSLAQNAPGTGTADFFIIMGGMPGLDAGSGETPDDAGFAVFGHVTKGMDVVHAIAKAPRSPTKGEGVMKGQMLEPQVRIVTARRAAAAD